MSDTSSVALLHVIRCAGVWVAILALFGASASCAADLALVGCRIYPSPEARPLQDATVLVHDGHVQAVTEGGLDLPSDASVIKCEGRTVTAGFWNSHVHILTPELMNAASLPAERISGELKRMFTRWGFTTVFDLASVLDNTATIRHRIERGEVVGPRVLTLGDPFYPPGGTPIYVKAFLEKYRVPSAEGGSAAEASARARRQLAKGADGVKLFAASFAGGGRIVPMPLAVARRVVAEAHRAGKPAFAHPSNLEGIEIALDSGVDVLAHTAPLSGPWPRSLIDRMRSTRTALVPTLTLFEVEAKKFGEPLEEARQEMEIALSQLRDYSAAGGEILFGTDVGYTDHFDTAEEYRLMSRAGLDFAQILASLTTNPCHRFRPSSCRGEIVPGEPADLVVLDGDPANDISALSRVVYTILGGQVIYSAN